MTPEVAIRRLRTIVEELDVIQNTTIGLGTSAAIGLGTASGIVGQVSISMEVTGKKHVPAFKIPSKRVCV